MVQGDVCFPACLRASDGFGSLRIQVVLNRDANPRRGAKFRLTHHPKVHLKLPRSSSPSGPPPRLAGAAGRTGSKPPKKHDELRLLINSQHPIITVETPEEDRV